MTQKKLNKRQTQALRTKLGRLARNTCSRYDCDACPFATCVVEIQTDRIDSNTCPKFVKEVLPAEPLLESQYYGALSDTHPMKPKVVALGNKKNCARCNDEFIAKGNRAKYCEFCKKVAKREQTVKSNRLSGK